MRILYLYAEIMGYQLPVFEEYTTMYDAEVHVVHWDHKKLTPYAIPYLKNVVFYNRSDFNYTKLVSLVKSIMPNIVYVSGWMDKDYLKVCTELKSMGIPIVAGCDTQWKGSFRQIVASFLFRLTYKRSLSYIWVAGPYQFEYARKLGFNKSEIIFNCLSADNNLFETAIGIRKKYPKNILFLGRLEEIKGISCLLQAWGLIEDKKGWTLTFIGNGTLKNKITNEENTIVKDFLQPYELALEIQNYGFLVLPSIKEPWALVIHEAMAAGIPVLASDVCGAAPVFIVPNYSGYIFKSNDVIDLTKMMKKVLEMTDFELKQMSNNAQTRSSVISPKIVASSFMSILNS